MRVRTHIKAGEFTAVSAAAETNGHGRASVGLNGAGWLDLGRLGPALWREAQPWLDYPMPRFRDAKRVHRPAPTTPTFERADRALQAFAKRWVDPLFGESGDHHLAALGLPVDETAVNPREKYINRHLMIALLTTGATVAGTTIAPPLLVVGALGTLFMTIMPAQNAYYFLTERRKLTTALATTLATVGAWLGGYYLAAALGGVLYQASEKLLFTSQNRARQSLVSVFGQQPRSAWVLVDGVEVEVPFDQVQVGDIAVVQAGQVIPVDGTIVRGVATIDQHALTGEAQPVERGVGDPVLATTVVLTGAIQVRVEKAGQATTAAEIAHIFNEVDSYQLSVQAKATDFGDQAVLPTLIISGLAWPLLGANSAVALLRLPLGSSLRLTAPITLLNYLNILAREGVLVKDGRSLELLAQVDTIVFDKTGTLTLEQPHVAQVHTVEGWSAEAVLALAATAEQRQSHPIARAIMTAAHEQSLPLAAIDDAHYAVGFGIQVHTPITGHFVEGQVIRVGSGRFMAMEGLTLPVNLADVQATCAAQGHSVVLVAVGEQVVGALELHATVRPEAQNLIQSLHARGLTLYILSGDQEAPTQRLAHELGMDHYRANVLPEGKAAVIQELQAQGRKVCFVGDGINDAIALKTAQVSVSLRGATTIAMDAAQIVLMDQSLDQFGRLLDVATDLEATQERGFTLTKGMRVALLGGVVLFSYDILWSLVIMWSSTVAGLLNATRSVRKYETRLSEEQRANPTGEQNA
ncbi:MAG: heavy metal translocating P-type ATPase [Anaerolineae bacterium]|nr:heavy metal translocating P-type ATPase [Anaerolineae bacterium]